MDRISPGRPLPQPPEDESEWARRSARLFEELRGPATAMVRRAFGRTFDQHAVEDIYASAWLGTLRALERRHSGLADEEIRRYVLTAVARQASKELRRRQRRPVSPLENADAISDNRSGPDERAGQREQSRITRDLLASLPRRRRAVLMLRYGWGLDPDQVCELIEGLSPRAYRKEITRGLDQLAERIRTLEKGEWCADREPILKAFAAGIADADQQRQAEHHLAHCRHCAEFVSRLSGQAHDLGSALLASGAFDLAADGRVSFPDRVSELADRARESIGGLVANGGTPTSEAALTIGPATQRGAGAATASVAAKLAGLGAAGKTAIACIGGGTVTALCVAAGVVGPLGGGSSEAVAGLVGGDRGGADEAPSLATSVLSRRAATDLGPDRVGPPSHGDAPPSAAQSSPRPWADGAVRVEARPTRSHQGPVVAAQHVKRNYWTRWSGVPLDGSPGEGFHSWPADSGTEHAPAPEDPPPDEQLPEEDLPTGTSTGPAASESP